MSAELAAPEGFAAVSARIDKSGRTLLAALPSAAPRWIRQLVLATHQHVVDQYTRRSGDLTLARELFPVLADIVAWHRKGTRYGIQIDAQDGLLFAGEDGAQLTWMDATARAITAKMSRNCITTWTPPRRTRI